MAGTALDAHRTTRLIERDASLAQGVLPDAAPDAFGSGTCAIGDRAR
jgi:hypothetical protein